MRFAGILPGVVSTQGFSERKTWHVAGDFVRDKNKRARRTFRPVEKIII